MIKKIGISVGLTLFGITLALLLIEIGMRVFFEALPPGLQGTIQNVQRYPWSPEKLIPEMPYIIDNRFQARLPTGLKNYPIHWGDARFQVDTISAWEGHPIGLRSTPPRWPLDILAFGDSFTFCWTAFQDCYVTQVATRTNQTFFNAALSGTGSAAQYNLMSELVEPMKPRIILWQWFNNDLTDNYDLARIRGEIGELPTGVFGDPPPPQTAVTRISTIATILQSNVYQARRTPKPPLYANVTANGRTLAIHTANYPFSSELIYPNNQYGWERDQAARKDAVALAERTGSKLLILLIPAKEEAYADQLTAHLSADYIARVGESRLKLIASCEANRWICLDLLPDLRKAVNAGGTIYYQYDGHLDAMGNKVVAEAVEAKLKSLGWLTR